MWENSGLTKQVLISKGLYLTPNYSVVNILMAPYFLLLLQLKLSKQPVFTKIVQDLSFNLYILHSFGLGLTNWEGSLVNF